MKETSNKEKIFIVLILLAILVFLAIIIINKSSKKNKTSSLTYDIERYKKTDEKIIDYSEVSSVKLNLDDVSSMAIDKDDNIYVSGDDKLIIFGNSHKEKFNLTIKEKATAIAVNYEGLIFIGFTDHIKVYSPKGEIVKAWDKFKKNSIITSLAVTDDYLFAADSVNKLVIMYDLSGKIIREIGKKDLKKNIPGFIIPSPYFDVAIGYEGHLWAVNSGRHSLENYSFNGDLRSSWSQTSMDVKGFSGCCNPTHIAFLSNGCFVTSEKGLIRVKIYDQRGKFKSVVAGPESFSDSTIIEDLAIDSENSVYVLDSFLKKIRIFKKKEE